MYCMMTMGVITMFLNGVYDSWVVNRAFLKVSGSEGDCIDK